MSEKKVCVITGGSSGMGFATARRMGKKGYFLVLAARTLSKLDKALEELREEGVQAAACRCDLSDWDSVQALAAFAAEQGTVHIHDAFYPLLAPGGCLVDTSSMSAYLAPGFLMPRKAYPLAGQDQELFLKKMMARVNLLPAKSRAGAAYAISKNFVIAYALSEAARFGKRGVRVLSVTPGNFDTPMGTLEKEEAQTYLQFNALPRLGQPDEIAALYAAVSDPEVGYLTGCDILCDGGCVAGRQAR